MTAHVIVSPLVALSAPTRRTLAILAAASAPETFRPRAIATIGIDDLDSALSGPSVVGLFTIATGCARDFISAPPLRFYLSERVGVVALCESVADAMLIKTALGTAGSA